MRLARVLVLALCVLVAMAFAATATAGSRHVTIQVDDTFVVPAGDLCEFPVTINVAGTISVKLVLNRQGQVVREIDTWRGGRITYSSANGSFSFMTNPIMYDYGEGAEIGSEVTIKIVGLEGHAPGFISSDAGIVLLSGVVVDFDEFGIPLVEFGDVTFVHGHFNSPEDIDSAICAALS
jgi:hypothetical protein